MGLAASQARFLAVTARKANCEFRSMQIAQDKLSVTRDLARISADYQDAMNKTTLVWDYDGTGTAPMELSYGLMMTPSFVNGFNPYLLTERTGAIVLSSSFAKAAADAGIPREGGQRSESGFKAFMNALADNNIIGESTATSITDFIEVNTAYNKDAGYGATPLSKNGVFARNTIGLAYRVKDQKLSSMFKGTGIEVTIGKDSYNLDDIMSSNNITDISKIINTAKAAEGYKILVDGSFQNASTIRNKLSMADLLTKDVVLVYTSGTNRECNLTDQEKNKPTVEITQAILRSVHKAMQELLGVDAESILALEQAYGQISSQYRYANQKYIGDNTDSYKAFDAAYNGAVDFNGFTFGDTRDNIFNRGNRDSIAVDLSKMVASYLTYFELAVNGYDSSFFVGATADGSNFVTDDPNYNYIINDPNNESNVDIQKADFYMQLYNNICKNGWSKNEKVEKDNAYVEQMLKNGTFFLSTLSFDGYYYQGRYNDNDCIVEVKDKDAIAQAEADFQAAKAKLTYKEEKLDLEMKNLDVEISSLTTEYDSVKQLISKNVEKVFSQFQ